MARPDDAATIGPGVAVASDGANAKLSGTFGIGVKDNGKDPDKGQKKECNSGTIYSGVESRFGWLWTGRHGYFFAG